MKVLRSSSRNVHLQKILQFTVCIEETYAIIQQAHIATDHGGHDHMLKHLSTKNANITRECVDLFKSYCVLARSHKLRQS